MARIFVSYRREDSPGHIGRLYDHLVAHFGKKLVFRDIETIEPGADFVHTIEEAVESCGVLLAVIGPQWLGARDKQGRRRLDNPKDFVRLEVAAALSRDVRVIPVLVGGATFPSEEELPPDLAPLARRNAIEINDPHFRTDMAHLIRAIQSALDEKHAPAFGVPRPGVQWRRWGAAGLVITFAVMVLAGILRVLHGQEVEGIGGAGDAGVGPALHPVEREQKGTGGSEDAGMTGKTPPISPRPKTPGKLLKPGKRPPPLPRDAGVVPPTLEDAGSDAGVVPPTLEDAGSDAGVVPPTLEDAGSDAGVVPPTLEDAGSDAGVVPPTLEDAGSDAGVVPPTLEDAGSDAGVATPPPWDEGTMDEDGGTGGSEEFPPQEPESPAPPQPEPESPALPQPEPESPALPQPEPEPDSVP
ncbi:toll/interleukin-1 receptor domain-containing protein [Cystobacter ferrugineus]|uniref:TIR domain-containing protein n=1 Tax=Cystobacter ferrugineus TaxID=83449 RepID=A0A1L9B149_9BACT|nr:toll/interleukin-1 receptor domain-containing protein [Cystobacter ferrugineus]OJH35946.1 hypothetical protein BON30_35635 [Cystobacter ferrugineus]